MAQHSAPRPPSSSRSGLLGWTVLGVVAALAAVLGLGALEGDPAPARSAAAPATGAAEPAPAAAPGELPVSSTYTVVDAAPADPGGGGTDGVVVHPVRETTVHDGPGGTPIARLETRQFGDTWLPVIDERDGWVHVLLPSRPNGSSGWLRGDDLERAETPYAIAVHLGSRTLELSRGGEQVGEWTVGIGKEAAPTPTGRSFLLGAFSDENQQYSPVILPLGAHSPTHDTFGGGPGTVAIHTWPTDDVFGTASSDGCIRVPAAALERLTEVPLGTLVTIDAR
jgi:lipoprotein-anchoring transpeptidase ErfK/SrfK